MDREDSLSPPTLLGPHHGVGRQPVVGMHHIKGCPHVIFGGKEVIHERMAYVLDLVDEVAVQVEWAAVVPDAVNPLHGALASAHPREDVHLMSLALHGSSQFGDVSPYPADRN